MPERIISPPRSEWDSLRSPLQPGEREVYEFFDEYLDPEWEMYVQPHLNGLRPDLVLVNEAVGVAVFEIKDWRLAEVNYRFLSSSEVEIRKRSGETEIARNPLDQVRMYEAEIRNLYSPRLRRAAGMTVMTAGVIFPLATRADGLMLTCGCADDRSAHAQHPISGKNELATGDLGAIFPALESPEHDPISAQVVQDLRTWLVEPRYPADMRRPIALDDHQKHLAQTRPTRGFRRIRGPAGSGKTVVLASRAAQLQREDRNQDILFVTYNITLLNFLADLLSRAGGRPTDLTRLNFHSWAKRVLHDVGWGDRYDHLWRSLNAGDEDLTEKEVFRKRIPELVIEALADPERRKRTNLFDAIFVDEGQDFLPDWWSALRGVLKDDNGEMVLAADFGQSLYSADRPWTESQMTGAGFTGQWAELKTSYRLPEELRVFLDDFQKDFAGSDYLPLERSAQTRMETCQLRWHACARAEVVEASVAAVLSLVEDAPNSGAGASDVTVIASSKESGAEIERVLRERTNYRIRSTFKTGEKDERELKLEFGRSRERSNRISVTTIQSFKGFEAPLAVVVLTGPSPQRAYVALSRLGGDTDGMSLIVVCSNAKLNSRGSSWPRFEVPRQPAPAPSAEAG